MKKHLLLILLISFSFSLPTSMFAASVKTFIPESPGTLERVSDEAASRISKKMTKRMDRLEKKIRKKMDRLQRKGKWGQRFSLGFVGTLVMLIGGLFILLGLVIPAVGVVFLVIGIIIAFVGLLLLLLLNNISVDIS